MLSSELLLDLLDFSMNGTQFEMSLESSDSYESEEILYDVYDISLTVSLNVSHDISLDTSIHT